MLNKRQIKYYIILVLGIMILINVLASRYFFRLDFTEDQRHTLSETTKDIPRYQRARNGYGLFLRRPSTSI